MIKKFKNFLENVAAATAGNTNGMGNVVSANPSSTPGDVAGSSIGSGDIGAALGTFSKKAGIKKKKKKKKDLKTKENFNNEQNKTYDKMYVVKFGDYKYTKDEK